MDNLPADHRFEDMEEGQSFSFETTVTPEDITGFAKLSGDINPLHMDSGFAKERGFPGRVAHGALIGAYISRMVGVYCPGRSALLQTMDLRFLKPVYAGDSIRVRAQIDQVSPSTRTMILKVYVEDPETGLVRVRGKLQVGFTESGRV